MTDTETTIKPGVTDVELAALKKHDQVNVRQTDGVDTFGLYFELDHDRYDAGEVTHTLRVLWVAGHPIIQYKAKTARSAKWTNLPNLLKDNPEPSGDDYAAAFDSMARKTATFVSTGKAVKRGKPMMIQLQATDVEAIKRGEDAPMIRYTAKAAYEKMYGKGV